MTSEPVPTEVSFLDLRAPYDELRADLDAAQRRVMESGWYIGGPEVEAFEIAFAEYCGVDHCVGVGNGLDALHLILRAAGIGEGDEVIVPSNTYIATWLAVTFTGATPVPVEPDPATFNLDPARVGAAVTARTRAVMPVHLYGQPADTDALQEVADAHGLRIVEDAAQAQGARLRGRRVGALGSAAGFSFYPGKNLGAYGDAGAITTNDAALADQVRVLRNYGSRTKYHNEVVGYNSRLDPLQAALLAAKLPHLDAWNARRATIAAFYLDALSDVDGLSLPTVPEGMGPVWHLFVVRHARRDALQAALAAQGVQTLIHYPIPPHLQPAYATLGMGEGTFPLAEAIHREVLSLPIGPHLTLADAERVAAAVREACGRLHRSADPAGWTAS
ncbi:MAG TPA: DegT/DnrJ/EryC1/StrS family aminotransferase [Rubricoccaceae bacterium]|jgi:dTDP-4-amino-4,6-dideoxygalactose transaminase